MRKSEALYYPTVEPPIGWLRSAALFFDTVISFVPAESENAISKELWEFGEETKAWVPYSPTEGTALLVDIPTDKLDHAFEGIAAKKPERLNHFQIEIDREARISVKDHVFVHGSKLSDRVRERLKAYKLMLPEELPQSLINGDWWVVDEQASDLIVSYIADRLAATKGWTSITDHGDCYVFNALQRTDVGVNSTEAENQLASMLITELVPDVIELLPLEKYCELRKRHEPIREQLAIFVDEVVRKNRLNRIENTADLHEAVVECVRDLKKEVLNFRSSPFARTLGDGVPFQLVVC